MLIFKLSELTSSMTAGAKALFVAKAFASQIVAFMCFITTIMTANTVSDV